MENDKREATKKGEIERDNGELKCGLCKTIVHHWKQHIKSERHIKNNWMNGYKTQIQPKRQFLD